MNFLNTLYIALGQGQTSPGAGADSPQEPKS